MTASYGSPWRFHGSNTSDFNRPSIAAPRAYRIVAFRQLPIQFCAKCAKNVSTRKDGTTKFIIKPFRVFVLSCFRDQFFVLRVYPGWAQDSLGCSKNWRNFIHTAGYTAKIIYNLWLHLTHCFPGDIKSLWKSPSDLVRGENNRFSSSNGFCSASGCDQATELRIIGSDLDRDVVTAVTLGNPDLLPRLYVCLGSRLAPIACRFL